MASGIKSNGTDLDNIFAPYQTGQSKAASTGIESKGTDLKDRYSKFSYGNAVGATGIESAGNDLNTIFCGSINLKLYNLSTNSSTLSSANILSVNEETSGSSWTTYVSGNGSYAEMYSQGNAPYSIGAPTYNSLQPPTGHGFLYDTTALEGLEFVAGTFTPSISFILQTNSISCTAIVRGYKRSSGGVYTQIFVAQAPFLSSNTGTIIASGWSGNTIASPVSFGTGDKFYADVYIRCTAGFVGGTGIGQDPQMGEDHSYGWIDTPGFN